MKKKRQQINEEKQWDEMRDTFAAKEIRDAGGFPMGKPKLGLTALQNASIIIQNAGQENNQKLDYPSAMTVLDTQNFGVTNKVPSPDLDASVNAKDEYLGDKKVVKLEIENTQEYLQYASEKYFEWLEKKEKEKEIRQKVDNYDELLEKQKNDKEVVLEQLQEFLDNKLLEKENRAKEALEKKYVLGVDPYIDGKPELDQSKVEDWEKLMEKDSTAYIVKNTNSPQTYNEWLNEQKRNKLFGKEKKAIEILKESRFVQVSIGEWEALKKTLEETKNRFSISQAENEELKKAKCALLVTDGQHLPIIFSSITEEVVKKVVEVNDGLKDHIQNLELQNSKLAMEYLKAIDNSKLSDKFAAYEADENKYLKNRMKMFIGFSLLGLGLLIYDIVKLFF